MAMTFPVGGGGGDFKRLPAGTHVGICNMVADVGTQPGSQLYPDPKRQLVVRFETPGERVEYEKDGDQIEGPLTISRTLTASMNEKAALRKLLENWRGKKFSDDDAANFDVSTILGKACLLSISETEKGGDTYSNITGIGPLMKGMPTPEAENPLLYYGEDDRSKFDHLPKWVREKIEHQIQPKSEDQANEQAARQYAGRDEVGF